MQDAFLCFYKKTKNHAVAAQLINGVLLLRNENKQDKNVILFIFHSLGSNNRHIFERLLFLPAFF
ncbi:MAG: Unknown protein [uncultured Aureispira sp.]|uniref:Uncharacterized protein n=1 Tax=uncultured Aureispira sp. TaxID=1331704 RepID=A0A6S6U7I3_9BACT|nr:MAG: Unknown protein [uncultured Aureispira sp.]